MRDTRIESINKVMSKNGGKPETGNAPSGAAISAAVAKHLKKTEATKAADKAKDDKVKAFILSVVDKEKPTDDKPFLHFYNGNYYLSWGCFYAMADNVYGPYEYTGSIIEQESFAPGYDAPTWPNGFKQGRHGSFFEWHNQWYFAYCDISQTGNRYFRDTFISYIHYKDDGEMALIRIDGIGVGEYDADNGIIEAEDYFAAEGVVKSELLTENFSVSNIDNGDFVTFPNIGNLRDKKLIEFQADIFYPTIVEIHLDSPQGKLLTKCELNQRNDKKHRFELPVMEENENLCFIFKGVGDGLMNFDAFRFE